MCVTIYEYVVYIYSVLYTQAEVNQKNGIGQNAFFVACDRGDIKMVELLYEHILKVKSVEEVQQIVNLKDNNGDTLLHIACGYEYNELVKYLVTTMNLDVNLPDQKNRTALQIAQKMGYETISLWLSNYQLE